MGIFDFLKKKKNVPAPQAANTAPARLPDSGVRIGINALRSAWLMMTFHSTWPFALAVRM